MSWLLADIGGTNTRCATWSLQAGLGPVTRLANCDHPGVAEALQHFISTSDTPRPDRAMIGIAAPLKGDRVQMINIDWSFSQAEVTQVLDLTDLELINDFGAVAHSLPDLQEGDLHRIGGGERLPGAVRTVLGPGTGLGVATLVEAGESFHAVMGEGGHVSLAANTPKERKIIMAMQDRFSHCSAERIVSGAGISLVHEVMHAEEGIDAAQIGQRASQQDPAAMETLKQVFCFLGTIAADVALTVGAFGGVYIAGGIVPRHLELFVNSGFRERFENKGRYRAYLAAIPTSVITSADPAFLGLARLARERT